jgi:hypothetical protein
MERLEEALVSDFVLVLSLYFMHMWWGIVGYKMLNLASQYIRDIFMRRLTY